MSMSKYATRKGYDLAKEAEEWNRLYPSGTPVEVTRDNGSILTTKTRSEAWVMGEHSCVVMVDGISGGYLLERVRPVGGKANG